MKSMSIFPTSLQAKRSFELAMAGWCEFISEKTICTTCACPRGMGDRASLPQRGWPNARSGGAIDRREDPSGLGDIVETAVPGARRESLFPVWRLCAVQERQMTGHGEESTKWIPKMVEAPRIESPDTSAPSVANWRERDAGEATKGDDWRREVRLCRRSTRSRRRSRGQSRERPTLADGTLSRSLRVSWRRDVWRARRMSSRFEESVRSVRRS